MWLISVSSPKSAGRCGALIDRLMPRVNIVDMDLDDDLPRKGDDPLARLIKQDLGPLSMSELDSRIASLEAEIERTRRHKDSAVNHKASAEALFRR